MGGDSSTRGAAQIIRRALGSRGSRQRSGRLPVCWIRTSRATVAEQERRTATNVIHRHGMQQQAQQAQQASLNEHARWIGCICSTAQRGMGSKGPSRGGSGGMRKLCLFDAFRVRVDHLLHLRLAACANHAGHAGRAPSTHTSKPYADGSQQPDG